MEDQAIIALYWTRDDEAIKQSDMKYGNYCQTIALNITQNLQDAQECRSETWVQAWMAIPPAKPNHLKAFFGRITRNLALDVYRKQTAQKRGGFSEVLYELEDLIGDSGPQRVIEQTVLVEVINTFLKSLPSQQRYLFVRRYFYAESIKDLAKQVGQSPAQVTTRLFRLRESLRQLLEQEGYER